MKALAIALTLTLPALAAAQAPAPGAAASPKATPPPPQPDDERPNSSRPGSRVGVSARGGDGSRAPSCTRPAGLRGTGPPLR